MKVHSGCVLLTEGSSDVYSIFSIRDTLEIEAFPAGYPSNHTKNYDGIDGLIGFLPEVFKISGLKAVGVVVDSDKNRNANHQRLNKILFENLGYQLPPIAEEGIVAEFERFRFGLWFWPDNVREGDLETFLADFVPQEMGFEVAQNAVEQALSNPRIGLKEKDKRKAELYTWLGFQREPGRPFGSAISEFKYFGLVDESNQYKTTALKNFKSWLQRLYQHD